MSNIIFSIGERQAGIANNVRSPETEVKKCKKSKVGLRNNIRCLFKKPFFLTCGRQESLTTKVTVKPLS